MISTDLIRRHPFFAGLSQAHLDTLAEAVDEIDVETGYYFFHERDTLPSLYLILEGAVIILVERPTESGQTKEVVVSALGPGEVFAWSALVPPHKATAGARAVTPCRVLAFDGATLKQAFKEDGRFGYMMTQRAAQVIQERMRDVRIIPGQIS